MKKVAYFRDGLVPEFVVRETVEDGKAVAEIWDYKAKKWVPDADAWETIEDQRGNWSLDADAVEGYIQRMLERFPEIAEKNLEVKAEGAERKYPWW